MIRSTCCWLCSVWLPCTTNTNHTHCFFDVSWTGLGFDNELKEYEDDGGIVEFSHALVRNTHLRHLRMFGVVLGHVASAALAGGVRRFRPTCSMRSTV